MNEVLIAFGFWAIIMLLIIAVKVLVEIRKEIKRLK